MNRGGVERRHISVRHSQSPLRPGKHALWSKAARDKSRPISTEPQDGLSLWITDPQGARVGFIHGRRTGSQRYFAPLRNLG